MHHSARVGCPLRCMFFCKNSVWYWLYQVTSSSRQFILTDKSTGFLGGSVVNNLPANAGDIGSSPGSRRSPGEGNGNPLQYSSLENSMGRGSWEATVHGVTKSRTWLSHYHFHFQAPISSVQFSCSVVPDSLRPHESQHAKPPCPPQAPTESSIFWLTYFRK